MSGAVLGWDLSLRASGLTLPNGDCYTIRPTLKGDHRLGEIRAAAHYYIREAVKPFYGKPTVPWLAVMETPSNIGRGGWDTTCAVLFAHAIVRDVLAEFLIPHVYIHNQTLKKYSTGYGGASKQAMVDAANTVRCTRADPDLVVPLTDDNQADSWWLWAAGEHFFGRPVSVEVELGRDVLFGPKSTIEWPGTDPIGRVGNRAKR
jgi:hypothetical protein